MYRARDAFCLTGGQLSNHIMESWEIREKARKGVAKANEWLSDCVLKEVAIQRLGGERFFIQAVSRGAVRRVVKGVRVKPTIHAS